MPNWWLTILYLSIAFAFVYWAALHVYGPEVFPGQALSRQMELAAQEAAKKSGQLSNAILWGMSRDPKVLESGKAVYLASCAPCHLPDLAGAIGPNLKDQLWIHGAEPMTILRVITEGVGARGMPTWGPVLGRQKISEVTAYLLSFHTEGEPVTLVQPPTPGAPAPAPAPNR
jgi:cytochrome c oxidase cbb3-type subunit 3